MLCETCHNESTSGIRCDDCGVLLCPACFKNHHCQTPPPLWAHQERGLANLQKTIDEGEKAVCVVAPCGGGKTRMMCEQAAIDVIRGKRVTIYTNRKLLRVQTSRKFDEHGIEHGVMAAGHQPALLRDVQVASIQTVHSRVIQRQRWELHDSDIVMIDECHANKADTAQEIIKRHKEAGAVIVGWTATPVSISHIYDRLIVAGTKSELRKCGALVPCVTFGPDEPDMHGVKRNQVGEYSVGDIVKQIHMQTIFGRVYPHWQRLNPDGRPTILFAPGVAESKWFVERFNRRGVSAAHIDADTPDSEREDILEGSKEGHVKIISNRYVCLDSETEILARRGWVGIDAIDSNDDVANWQDGRIWFAKPTKVIRRPRAPGEDMVFLETPRRSIRVTTDHELLYRTTKDGRFLKDTAGNLVGRSVAVPVSGLAEPLQVIIEQLDMTANFAQRVTKNAYAMRKRGFDSERSREEAAKQLLERVSLRYKQPAELTLDECEFIGFWIGDGNRNRLKRGGVEYRMSQTTKYTRIVERIDALCRSLEVDVIRHVRTKDTTKGRNTSVHWFFSRGTGFGNQKRRGLFRLEPYLEKDGTDLFWGLNSQQFDRLIRGLWMADGCPHHNEITLPSARVIICGANSPLFDLLQGIAVCRGYRASIRSYAQSNPHYTKPLFLLTLTKHSEHRMTKYPLCVESVWQPEDVWCVTTDSGNIITRRKGSVTVLGNCREGIDLPHLEHCIFATVFGALSSFLQAGGRLLRAYPGIDKVCLQDHGGSFHRHGSLNQDRTWKLGDTDVSIHNAQQTRRREAKEAEPICCPKCGGIRMSGSICPFCGHQHKRSVRRVIQLDGTLKRQVGNVTKHKRQVSSEQAAWDKCFYRALYSWMTFDQAAGLYRRENGRAVPMGLQNMPSADSVDWQRKVRDVYPNRVRRKKRAVH